ncbi:MAG: TPR end-of-group domain-containing protein, partial [Myxococcaceae bacterium]
IVASIAAVAGYAVGLIFASVMFGFLAVRSGLAFNQVGKIDPPPTPTSEHKTDPLERGWAALSAGDDADAERAARQIITSTEELEPRNRAFDLLAWVDLARGNPSSALRQLDRVRPSHQIRALTQALALEATGDQVRALPAARAAHAKEPSESTASLTVRLLTSAGEFDEAEKIAEEFRWPKEGAREASLGGVRHARGDYAAAAKLLQLAFGLRKRPTDAFNAACSHARAGDPAAALSWLERAVNAGLNDASLLESDPDLESVRQLPEFAPLLPRAKAQR